MTDKFIRLLCAISVNDFIRHVIRLAPHPTTRLRWERRSVSARLSRLRTEIGNASLDQGARFDMVRACHCDGEAVNDAANEQCPPHEPMLLRQLTLCEAPGRSRVPLFRLLTHAKGIEGTGQGGGTEAADDASRV